MDKKYTDLILLFFLFLLLISLIVIFLELRKGGIECMNNPNNYFISRLNSTYHNLSCFCYDYSDIKRLTGLEFDMPKI